MAQKAKATVLQKIEIILNTLNHVAIGAIAIYLTVLCWNLGPTAISLHTWLSAIGYQLFMAEAIIALYSENSWSHFSTRRAKSHVHWIMQAIATGFVIAGTLVLFLQRTRHFGSTHSKLGLASNILVLVGVFNGVPSLFSYELKRFIRPPYTKFFHNLVGFTAFVLGMTALIYGYKKRTITSPATTPVAEAMMWGTGISCLLSSFGAFRSAYSQLRGMFSGN